MDTKQNGTILLSELLLKYNSKPLVIEPVAKEGWDNDGYYIQLRYKVLPVLISNGPEQKAMLWYSCNKKLYSRDIGEEKLAILWSELVDDLILNSEDNSVVGIVKNEELWF